MGIAKEESVGFPSSSSGAADLETLVMPHLGALADFRGAVRGMARQVKATDILAECDKLRDITLPDLGVRLEDKEGEPTVIKLVDKEELRREREEKLALEEKKRLEKQTNTVLGMIRGSQLFWLMERKCPRLNRRSCRN